MRFDQAPLGGASNDLPTDDPVFILEQIAEQLQATRKKRSIGWSAEALFDELLCATEALARQMAKGVA